MQMPMPQSGPRASPRTENRQGSLAIMIAAATLAPSAMRTSLPLTVMEQLSSINRTLPLAGSSILKPAASQNEFRILSIIAYFMPCLHQFLST
jgi:hypothetical protein